MRYESSRGHKIDRTKPNQTGSTFEDKQGNQTKRMDKRVANKVHRRDKQGTEKKQTISQTEETN